MVLHEVTAHDRLLQLGPAGGEDRFDRHSTVSLDGDRRQWVSKTGPTWHSSRRWH